jgi:YD repeat-containing protein
MYPKKSSIPITIVLLFAWGTAFSQTATTSYTPKIIPPSPNSATIAKFGDIPVSPYTGTTDISIPIYTVSTKDISVPVGLDYHTGGIRLSEESGLVGLGWALNAGGVISRTVNDKDDFTGHYFNGSFSPDFPEFKGKSLPHISSSEPTSYGDWGYWFSCNYKVYTETGTVNFFPNMVNLSFYDMEPDMYNFNFPGGSGKFIIGRDGKIILQKQENVRIEFATDGAWFVITDEHGNKFYFLDIELSQPATGVVPFSKSSWLLSKIVTQQKDSVIFNYSTGQTWTTVKGISHETLRLGVPDYEQPIYSNDAGQTYLNKTLDNIDWANGRIQFEYDSIRNDLQNGKKLTAVKVYSKDQSGLHYQKENRFYYSYFNSILDPLEFQRLKLDSVKELSGSTVLPPYKFDYNVAPSMQNLMGKHYSSVDHWGYFNGKSNGILVSNGTVDFTKGFTPPYIGFARVGPPLAVVNQYIDLPGSDRESDFAFMQSFSLNKVTYPTGGATQIEYEPNYYDYDSSNSNYGGRDFEYIKTVSKIVPITINSHGTNGNGNSSGTINFSDIYQISSSGSNGNLTVSFRAARSDSMSKYHSQMSFGNIYFIFNGNTFDITNSSASMHLDGSGTIYSLQTPITISSASTNYNWSAMIDPKIKIPDGFIEVTATFTYSIPQNKTTTMMMAGGLRLKSITDYAATGTIAKKRTYDYGYLQDRNGDGTNETYSYGRLMGYLSYSRMEPIEVPIGNQGGNYAVAQSFTRYSSNFSGFTSLSSGNIVGYNQVTEYIVDPANSNSNGKTVYRYYNSSDTSFSYNTFRLPGVNNLANNLNGVLRSKVVYKNFGQDFSKIEESNYYYRTTNRVIYDCMKYLHLDHSVDNQAGGTLACTTQNPPLEACSCPSQIDSATYQLMANFYPAISSEKILLDSTVEKIYDQNDMNKVIITKSYNFYDNPKHFQLTRNRTTDSKLNTHVALMKYPQDYITSGNITGNTILDSLIGKNMLGTVIEKRDSLYFAGSATGYITGAQLTKYRFLFQNVLGLDRQYQLAVASPVTNFQPYTISGNSTTQDNRYRQMISLDTYDNNYNIIQFTQANHPPSAFVYDYNKQYPVAQIIKATSDQIASTSFESDGKGNWNNFSGLITTVTSTPYPPTGNKYYNLTTSAPLSKGVTIGKSYTISYWSKNGIYSITGGGSTINTTGITVGAWTYYEQKITASSTTLTITGTGAIDEVRLYPADAQMTTYTYNAFGGLTSQCDINNRISYYEYDGLHRLSLIRDQNKNIIKQFCYNYAGQPTNCDGNIFYNVAKSQVFTKKECSPTYYNGSSITYNVNASKYYSFISQADADQKALDDIAANGQNYTNANGTCTIPPMINLKYTNSTPTSMVAVFKHKPSGTSYTFSLAANVTTQTIIGQIMQGGPYDVTITPTNGSFLYSYQVYSYFQNNIHTFKYVDMPTICSTCAIISVSNQH